MIRNNGMDLDTVKPINPYDLEIMYDQKFPNVRSADSHTQKVGTHKVLHMGLILRLEGIQRCNVCHLYTLANSSLFLFTL